MNCPYRNPGPSPSGMTRVVHSRVRPAHHPKTAGGRGCLLEHLLAGGKQQPDHRPENIQSGGDQKDQAPGTGGIQDVAGQGNADNTRNRSGRV